jgi:hypothetical protein
VNGASIPFRNDYEENHEIQWKFLIDFPVPQLLSHNNRAVNFCIPFGFPRDSLGIARIHTVPTSGSVPNVNVMFAVKMFLSRRKIRIPTDFPMRNQRSEGS